MNLRKYTVAATIIGAAAAGSFVATHAWQPPAQSRPAAGDGVGCASAPCGKVECCRSLAGWLRMPPEQSKQIRSIDPAFFEDSTKLEQTLYEERQRLADLFDDQNATVEAIQQQVERVISADNALERRVSAHLLALRPHLTAEQRAKLFERCAQGIRQAGGCRWRCGITTCPADDAGCGKGDQPPDERRVPPGRRDRHGRGEQGSDE